MNPTKLLTRASGLFTCLWLATCMTAAHAALVVTGPVNGTPGQSIVLHIGLDAPLVADIDEMELHVAFDPTVLRPVAASVGPLLAGSSFGANADTGLALISFGATLASLSAGELATWSFEIQPAIAPFTQTLVTASLDAFLIDSPPNASLASEAHTITVIPEPASYALFALGLGALVAGAGRRRSAARIG